MEQKDTQNNRLIQYLELYGSITPLEALADLGIMRLAARISDVKGELAKRGVRLKREMVTDKNRFGETVHYMRYRVVCE